MLRVEGREGRKRCKENAKMEDGEEASALWATHENTSRTMALNIEDSLPQTYARGITAGLRWTIV